MTNKNSRFWPTAAQTLVGGIAVALITFVCLRLRLNLATTMCLYLVVVVLLSVQGNFLASAVVSVSAVVCLAYYFAPPIFSFRSSDPFDVLALIVFLITSAVITHFVSRVRKATEGLGEQANLLNLTHDTIFVRDMNDVITYWNRGAEELYGWQRNEALGKVSHELTQTIFPAPLEEINETLLRTGRWDGELIHTKRDGAGVVVASRWSLHRDEQGKPLAILETNNNITERKHAEEKLRERANLLDLTHDAIFVRDMNDTFSYWNRGAMELYGWTSEETIGQVTHTLLHTVFPEPLEQIKAELLATHRWEGELIHTKRDGTEVLVASRWSLLRDDHGNALSVLETNNDITERRRAEVALRESEEQWKAVFENNPTMYFMVDADGITLSVNALGAEQLGYIPDELVGRPVLDIFYEADREAVGRNVARSFDQLNQSINWEARKVRKDGKVICVRETARAVLLNNRPVILVACEDITEHKHAEEALQKTQTELAHVTRVTTLGELTASIAHEVNQPIAAAVTNAGACLRWLAAQPPDMERARQALERIVRDCRRAGEVIGRVRTLVKKAPQRKESVDVNDVIQEVIALAQSEIQRNRVSLKTQLSDGLPRVLGDRIQLQQVILNLIINGVEAMSRLKEEPRELLIRTGKDESNSVLVAVRDTGVGLDSANLDQLFDAFFTTKPEGMGMGLSISRSIVEAHGGRLWATPNEPHGAVFQLTLPVEGVHS